MIDPPDPTKVKAVVDQAFEKWRCAAHCDEKSERYHEKLARVKSRVDEFFKRDEEDRVLLALALDACEAVACAKDAEAFDEAQANARRVLGMANRR